MTSPFYAADLRIDHVTMAGEHLGDMREAFTAATGIPTEYGGRHANHATEMALASFPDGSYVELMGIQPHADPSAAEMHTWGPFLKTNGGPCAFAVRVGDVKEETERFKKLGIHAGRIEKSGRTRPDGVVLSWETVDVGPGARGSFFPFLIHDFTPHENRVYPSGKPTTANVRGIGMIVIAVHDLAASIEQYRMAFGLAEPKRQADETFGAEVAWFESTPIALAAALNRDSWLARRLARYGDAPCAFVLDAATSTLETPTASDWFGHSIHWVEMTKFGGRIGLRTR